MCNQTETLTTFEFTGTTTHKPHSILFVGGLGDGMATTSYMADLVHALKSTPWSIFTLNLSSAYNSWGMGHLDRDTDEIATCLSYIRDYKTDKFGSGKIVLMGHSTGSQNVLHYLHRPNPHQAKTPFDPYLEHMTRPALDGAIMQAPVSDRQAVQLIVKEGFGTLKPEEMKILVDELVETSRTMLRDSSPKYDPILPLSLSAPIYGPTTPLSCRRFLSLYSPESPEKPSEDDLFSSDLSDEQLDSTFGQITSQGLLKNKLMVLISGADQSMPPWVSKEGQLRRWARATDQSGRLDVWDHTHTAVIPNASHALSNDDQAEPRQFLCEKVLGYLRASEKLWASELA